MFYVSRKLTTPLTDRMRFMRNVTVVVVVVSLRSQVRTPQDYFP